MSLEVDGAALTANCVVFGRLLRRAGLHIDPDQTRSFTRALGLLGLGRKADVRAAGRVIYVRRREDRTIFDEAFELFWKRRTAHSDLAGRLPRLTQSSRRPGGLDLSEDRGFAEERSEPIAVVMPHAASSHETIRNADCGELTGSEERDARRMIAALRPQLPLRPARRGVAARTGALDRSSSSATSATSAARWSARAGS